MECPAHRCISDAVSKCPFLANLSASHGENFARHIATKPAQPAPLSQHTPVFEESLVDFQSTLKFFHGPHGVVPLQRFAEGHQIGYPSGHLAQEVPAPQQLGDHAETVAPSFPGGTACRSAAPSRVQQPVHPGMASISSSAFRFLPDPSDFLRGILRGQQARTNQQKNGQQGSKQRPSSQRGQSGKGPTGRPATASGAAGAAASGGQCPLRKFVGPLGGLISLSAKRHLKCPAAVIQMRAAVAKLKPVRELRPQPMLLKALALGSTGAAVNVPFGMWRHHTEKFSPGWFLAVHATVPFIAVLRKAVIMPKWAIALTLGSAIVGQAVGARLEGYRLAAMQEQEAEVALVHPEFFVEAALLEQPPSRAQGPNATLPRSQPCAAEHSLGSRCTSFAMPLAAA